MGLIYPSYSLVNDPSHENNRRVKNRVRIFKLSGLLGFLIGNIF